jgi:hypothetical protein
MRVPVPVSSLQLTEESRKMLEMGSNLPYQTALAVLLGQTCPRPCIAEDAVYVSFFWVGGDGMLGIDPGT